MVGTERRFLCPSLWRTRFYSTAYRTQRPSQLGGGYFIGPESYIPALDYFTKVKEPVDWKWAFQRQWLFYKPWRRLLYDSDTPDSIFQNEFTKRYGDKAENLLNAYSLASSKQLRLASLYDSKWDFTLYSEGFLALQGDHTKYIGVDALIEQPVMEMAFVSVSDFVNILTAKGSFPRDKITPPVLIQDLERDNLKALELVATIDTEGNASLMYKVADIKVWANLGLHLVEKLKGTVSLQTYRISGGEEYQQDNLFHWELIRHEVAIM